MNRTVNVICASLMSVFMMSCASRPPLKITTSEDILGNDCEIMRNIIIKSGKDTVQSHKELVGFSELCSNHKLLAMLVNHEVENPEMEALVTTATLHMLAEASPNFKRSVLAALADYHITQEDLIKRKKIDDGIKAVRTTKELDCTPLDEDENTFYCE